MPETFNRCSSLPGIHLPEGLLTIREYAFAYCAAMKELRIPSTIRILFNYDLEQFITDSGCWTWWNNGIAFPK